MSEQKTTRINRTATVRVQVVDALGKILLVQKTSDSKNPNMYELPGGKIENVPRGSPPTVGQQIEAAVDEMEQETSICARRTNLAPVGAFGYQFDVGRTRYQRDVYVWRMNLLEAAPEVIANATIASDGSCEDKHQGHRWVSPEEYRELIAIGRIATNSLVVEL